MPEYAKFKKDLITKKREVSCEQVDNIHYYSVVAIRSLVEKKEDLGDLNIPYTIGYFTFSHTLCDLDVSINLIPFALFIQLELGALNPPP